MATEQRLPVVNSDDGEWGGHLNAFLGKEHYNGDPTVTPGTSTNGGHKTITIQPGTATANSAPLKFTSGTLLSTPELGTIEFNDNGTNGKLYATYKQATVTTRLTVAAYNDASGATGDVYYRDVNGNLIRLAIGATNDVLTVTGGVPAWSAPTPGASPYDYGMTYAQAAGIFIG